MATLFSMTGAVTRDTGLTVATLLRTLGSVLPCRAEPTKEEACILLTAAGGEIKS